MLRRSLFTSAFAAITSGGSATTQPAVRHIQANWNVSPYKKHCHYDLNGNIERIEHLPLKLPVGAIDPWAQLSGRNHDGVQVGNIAKIVVDGRHIHLVWYVDTLAGIVGTYDVMGDGKHVAVWGHKPEDFPGRMVSCELNDVLYETLHGKVQVFDSVTGELMFGNP
jgi:hypothetical protein